MRPDMMQLVEIPVLARSEVSGIQSDAGKSEIPRES